MKKVLIVDDETIVRFTLRSMIEWERFGFEIAADCMNAAQALEYLGEQAVDLLITDMKMPDMSGIELLRQIAGEGNMPVTLVLSGYNEFELVREAFRLGAYDYVLKSDLNAENMARILTALNEKVFEDRQPTAHSAKTFGDRQPAARSAKAFEGEQSAARSAKTAEYRQTDAPEEGCYSIVLFEVDDFLRQAARFGEDLKGKLERPVLELAGQIPRVAARARLYAVNPARYILYYKVKDMEQYRSGVVSVTKQLQAVWRDYMNLSVSAGISRAVDVSETDKALNRDELLLRIGAVYGRGFLGTEWEDGALAGKTELRKERYELLVKALYSGDELMLETEKEILLREINSREETEAKEEILTVIALLAMKFREYDDDFHALFPDEIDYGRKLRRIGGSRELELWVNNYFRWVIDYIINRKEQKQLDIILRAKRFIADNYANPELTLRSVADYIGLNEKYFSSRFTKESGSTFSGYLTDVRLRKAKHLMHTTDLKMYEISERVGYNNVEHFNRMFKRMFGISPGDYKKLN